MARSQARELARNRKEEIGVYYIHIYCQPKDKRKRRETFGSYELPRSLTRRASGRYICSCAGLRLIRMLLNSS